VDLPVLNYRKTQISPGRRLIFDTLPHLKSIVFFRVQALIWVKADARTYNRSIYQARECEAFSRLLNLVTDENEREKISKLLAEELEKQKLAGHPDE
jgi:hypothetical protein